MFNFTAFPSNRRSMNSRPPRKIEEFKNPLEFLQAMHDAVESHLKYLMENGEPHGNITTETIYIGSPSVLSNRKGFIVPSTTTNPIFQSANVLTKANVDGRVGLPNDYLDDLESFYYIIAWVSMVYTAPGERLAVNRYPDMLASWAVAPNSKEAALTKEALLRGRGFGCRVAEKAIFDEEGLPASNIFEVLLGHIHLVLRHLNNEKWDKWDTRRRQYVAARTPESKVYGTILDLLKRAVLAMTTSVESYVTEDDLIWLDQL